MGCLSSKNSVGAVGDADTKTNPTVYNANDDREVPTPGGESVKSHDSGFVDRNAVTKSDTMQKSVLPAIKQSQDPNERLPVVREEDGLMIQRSLTSTAFGYSFEVIDPDDIGKEAMLRRRLPVRLAKLEGKRRILTDEEINEKLEKAERRKRHQEQLRLDRIRALQLTDVNSAHDAMIASQTSAAQAATLKSQLAAENRDRLLQERRVRMASAGRLRRPQEQPPPEIENHRPVAHSPVNDISTALHLGGGQFNPSEDKESRRHLNTADAVDNDQLNNIENNYSTYQTEGLGGMPDATETENGMGFDEVDCLRNKATDNLSTTLHIETVKNDNATIILDDNDVTKLAADSNSLNGSQVNNIQQSKKMRIESPIIDEPASSLSQASFNERSSSSSLSSF